MIFVESRIFSKQLESYLADEDYSGLQDYLIKNPSIGNVIRGSGGVRKVRWAQKGIGKRGGLRVLYYWDVKVDTILFLTIFSKREKENIPSFLLKQMLQEFTND